MNLKTLILFSCSTKEIPPPQPILRTQIDHRTNPDSSCFSDVFAPRIRPTTLCGLMFPTTRCVWIPMLWTTDYGILVHTKAGAGVGIGMCWGGGDSFKSFKNWIDPIFKRFKSFHFMFSGSYWSHIQDVWQLLKLTFWICRGLHFPRKYMFLVSFFHFPKSNFRKGFGFRPWICWNTLVGARFELIGFGSHGHVRYVRKSWKWWVSGFPKNESQKLQVQNETE